MLDPQNRTLLRDALRPPPGYTLDRAIATTFSLDLMALLAVPVSFTFFGLKDHDGPPAVDPLALLESLRRHANKITVFCQAGQIHVPRQVQLLLGYLEGSVHEVQAPRGGVFHPKLTVLRYVLADTEGEHADEQPITYRLLCSSRNLTFDRSWDTLLVLDGELAQHRKNAFARNHPLSRFVASLPALAVHPLKESSAREVADFAEELQRVDFDIPEGFEELEFCPLGIDGAARWPILESRRTLAMAPFVEDGFIRRFADRGVPLGVIARVESLDELSVQSLQSLFSAWYLNTAADPSLADGEPASDAEPAAANPPEAFDGVELSPSLQLHGLHAKLFIGDDGWKAHVWTGSANATTAAFERNVEFMVHLAGKKSRCGIAEFLGQSGDVGDPGKKDASLHFANLIVPYHRDQPLDRDTTQQELERLLDEVRYAIAGTPMIARVELLAPGETGPHFRVTVDRTKEAPVSLPAGISVRCYPLTLRAGNALPVELPIRARIVTFEPLSFMALTSFYAFEITVRIEQAEASAEFVVNLPLLGAPEDRTGRILLSLLRNREQLLRYLLMLLADDEDAARRLVETFTADHQNRRTDGAEGGWGLPLLEPLLVALDRRPTSLDQIHRLIEDLRQSPEGRQLVSEQFISIWEPIWAARKGHSL